MPRDIEFDNDAVMSAVVQEFRQHGYAGTSIKFLERATGLSSGSLYNSFGGKEEIFAKALAHYNATVVQHRIKEHLESKPPDQAIRSLFLSLLDEPGESSHGCLLTNSAIEFGTSESVAKSGVQQGLDLLENAFQVALDRMSAAHRTTSGSQPAQSHTYTAVTLLALYQGILVLVRFGRSKKQLRKLINSEIDQFTGKAI